jgi:hypothetical protein
VHDKYGGFTQVHGMNGDYTHGKCRGCTHMCMVSMKGAHWCMVSIETAHMGMVTKVHGKFGDCTHGHGTRLHKGAW